jgi:hypothetical protein
MAKRKKDYDPEAVCLGCRKPPLEKERVSKEKDFVCSRCVLSLVADPRKYGESLDEYLEARRKNV